MSWQFTWRAFLARDIDGDTVDLFMDKGGHDYTLWRIRLAGINTPEDHRPTKEAGAAATAFTQAWMEAAHATAKECINTDGGLTFVWPLSITTYKSDAFDRYLGVIITREGDPVTLNDALLASGNAVPFMVDKVQT